MKSFLLLLLIALSLPAFAANTPANILAEYHEKAAPAIERVNIVLEKFIVPIIANLVKTGDTAGAETLQEQLKAKKEGLPVNAPHPAATSLFNNYDIARAKALEPSQKSAIARIDAVLASSDGKKLEVISELGKVRAEIEAGRVQLPVQTTPPTVAAVSIPKGYLKQNKIPKKWSYYLTQTADKRHGTLTLNDDGTLSIDIASPATGTWAPTADPAILAVDIQNAAQIPEKTEIIIKGNEATFKRVSGMRYLRAE